MPVAAQGGTVKIRTRLAAWATALTAALASVFIAAPALAHEGETFNPADAFSTAGQPLNVLPILIVGVVLLAAVLITATLISNLFEKKVA